MDPDRHSDCCRLVVDLDDVVVATVTWARSDEESERLIESLDVLRRVGLRVIVADRGDHPAFLRRLTALDGLSVSVAQAQDAVARAGACGTRFILYTEPDKRRFFESGLRQFLQCAPADDDIGAVIAARSPASFGTFPRLQRYTEDLFNRLAAELIGVPGDYCYGPFAMPRMLIETVARVPPHLGWGWRPATFIAAHRQGGRLVHLEADYDCPLDQREEDEAERTLRIRQLGQNVLGLVP